MPEPDLIKLFVGPLSAEGIRYLVSGSVAAMLYSEPRVTHDIDLVVFLRADQIARLPQLYPQPEFYVPPPEVIAAEVMRVQRGHFNIIHVDSALKADFYTANRDEFQVWAFRNARRYEVSGILITLSPPEYVIVRKLEFFREGGSEKHLRDIRAMLRLSGDQIDRSVLVEWVCRQGVEVQWRMVQD